ISIVTDPSGNVFVTGYTISPNFPLKDAGTFFQGTGLSTGAAADAFILKFDNAGNRLWATYYGGSLSDVGWALATDASGNIFVTGTTASSDFPLQNSGTFFQGIYGGGTSTDRDAFVLKFDNTGNRLWATYYGGSANEYYDALSLATDASG